MNRDGFPLVPIVITLVAGICWAIFVLLYTLYLSEGFTLFQNIIAILMSIVVVGCVLGLIWVNWVYQRRH